MLSAAFILIVKILHKCAMEYIVEDKTVQEIQHTLFIYYCQYISHYSGLFRKGSNLGFQNKKINEPNNLSFISLDKS